MEDLCHMNCNDTPVLYVTTVANLHVVSGVFFVANDLLVYDPLVYYEDLRICMPLATLGYCIPATEVFLCWGMPVQ
jgi:hypothetical protein